MPKSAKASAASTRTEIGMKIEERLVLVHAELENITDALTALVDAVTGPRPAERPLRGKFSELAQRHL